MSDIGIEPASSRTQSNTSLSLNIFYCELSENCLILRHVHVTTCLLTNRETLIFLWLSKIMTFLQDSQLYVEWKYNGYPNIVQILDEFPSLRVSPSLLLTQLPRLQHRYYSISSSPTMYPGEIHATVAVVRNRTHGKYYNISSFRRCIQERFT